MGICVLGAGRMEAGQRGGGGWEKSRECVTVSPLCAPLGGVTQVHFQQVDLDRELLNA